MKKLLPVIVTFIIVIAGLGVFCNNKECRPVFLQGVHSFDECKQKGYTIESGPPARCIVNENKVFIQKPQNSSSTSSATISSNQFVSSSASSLADQPNSVTTAEFDPLANLTNFSVPDSVILEVPFTPQAPNANWDPPFDEACEEASLIMVHYYNTGKDLAKNTANSEIINFTDWQNNNGYAIDITVADLAKASDEYYGKKAKVYYDLDVTENNIQALIASNYPVIIPAAGQLLGNPYFSGDGPPYHMLVITGYDQNNFYTNDPGTKRGAGFVYKKSVIFNAIADWTGSIETITTGKKAMLVVEQ